jgi:hypothetical protein
VMTRPHNVVLAIILAFKSFIDKEKKKVKTWKERWLMYIPFNFHAPEIFSWLAAVEKIDHLWLIELGWQSFVMPLSSAFRRQSVLHDHIYKTENQAWIWSSWTSWLFHQEMFLA